MIRSVSILGLGLMGGSLGLALRKRCPDLRVHGYTRSEETGRKAVERGAVHTLFESPAEAVREADLVVYCAPILTIPDLVSSTIESVKDGALLTDVGSTKRVLQVEIQKTIGSRDVHFIGSHPICGSERQGMDAARDDLYVDAMVILTPDGHTPSGCISELRRFWEQVGSEVLITTPDLHDRIIARTSHLPHVAAALLAIVAGRDDGLDHVAAYCGSGYRDTTRIAGGSPDIWHDILATNRPFILRELQAFRDELSGFMEKLENEDFDAIQDMFRRGREARKAFTDDR